MDNCYSRWAVAAAVAYMAAHPVGGGANDAATAAAAVDMIAFPAGRAVTAWVGLAMG